MTSPERVRQVCVNYLEGPNGLLNIIFQVVLIGDGNITTIIHRF